MRRAPLLAGKLAANSADGIPSVAEAIAEVLGPPES
jgi:hypothetical protein